VLVTRGGLMQGSRNFPLEQGAGEREESFMSFLTQYYALRPFPHEIICGAELDDELLRVYAFRKNGRQLVITRPKTGVKRELLDMAEKNAQEYLDKAISAIAHRNDMTVNACERLQTLLSLSRYPKRMECYDISNISGVDKVGSMVVFTDGEPDKVQYRRFRIKTVEGANDFASLKEVLTRRLSKLGTQEEERFPRPDLIVIDGGKGQLSSVKAVFDELGVTNIDLVSLAKREEEVFTCFKEDSIKINHRDYALKLLQRLRDEAHRFAITYFRSLHNKRNLASVLREVEGVGERKRKALMEQFGTIDKIMRADVAQLSAVEGIGEELARRIKSYFEDL
jgi:excinuclease ABC subunit C